MRYVPVAGCEDLEGYQPGGYHPVIIGEIFNRRYQVAHKLGMGGSATVWLARDKLSETWVAVKVMMADSTSKDLEMNQHLQKALGPEGCSPIVPLLDSFSLDGPNGHHLCLVFAVSGPSLASIRRRLIKIRPDVTRSLALKLVKALEKIHEAGVVFGDLSAANVLLKSVDIKDLSLEDIYAQIGQPSPEEVLEMPTEGTHTKPATSDNVPKFVYRAVDLAGANFEYVVPDVQFIDLGEAYHTGGEITTRGMSLAYAAPEVLLLGEKPTQASDIWALACIWFEMRAAKEFFPEGVYGRSGVENDIIDTIGALPQSWQDRMDDMEAEDADSNVEKSKGEAVRRKLQRAWGRLRIWLRVSTKEHLQEPVQDGESELALGAKILQIGKWKEWHFMTTDQRRTYIKKSKGEDYEPPETELNDHGPPPGPLSEQEARDFEDVLSSILKYEKLERPVLGDLIRSAWLTSRYESSMGDEPWLKRYSPGRTYGKLKVMKG